MTNKRVLLIDDDDIFNFIHLRMIERTGLATHVDVVKNGREALFFMQECYDGEREFPDIIFVDLNMPVMGGYDFLKEFRKRIPSIDMSVKVVVLTNSVDTREEVKVGELGVTHYITKPLTDEIISELWN